MGSMITNSQDLTPNDMKLLGHLMKVEKSTITGLIAATDVKLPHHRLELMMDRRPPLLHNPPDPKRVDRSGKPVYDLEIVAITDEGRRLFNDRQRQVEQDARTVRTARPPREEPDDGHGGDTDTDRGGGGDPAGDGLDGQADSGKDAPKHEHGQKSRRGGARQTGATS